MHSSSIQQNELRRFNSDAAVSTERLNRISSTRDQTVGSHVRYLKIAPRGVKSSSTSNDISYQVFREFPASESLIETTNSVENDGTGERRLQRHSHTKSRTGCFNCKKRRIKCEENRPSCTQCSKRRLQCEWPDLQIQGASAAAQLGFSGSSMPIQLKSAESSFSMQDFRLFYHFIQKAYPHHPVGNDAVWTHEIPSISHNYDYLLHAMLGLSAFDLTEKVGQMSDLALSAMSHRVQAINSLNKALSNGINTFEEGNAILATCYVLLFQSVHLDEGLPEYMFFIRGCVLVVQSMGYRRIKFLFHSILANEALAQLDPHLKEYPEINPESVSAGCESLEAFEHLCERDYEKSLHNSLLKTARGLYTSSRTAYLGIMEIYRKFSYTMSHEDFQHYIDPANEVGQLLQAHFVAVQLLLSPITVRHMGKRNQETPSVESVRWLGAILRRVTPRMREFFEWPVSVAQGIRTGSFYANLLIESPGTIQEDEDMSE